MAVSRKAMTEGIRTSLFPGTPCECNLTIPQSKIKDFCQLPLHKGAVGCSRTSAFFDSYRKFIDFPKNSLTVGESSTIMFGTMEFISEKGF